MKIASNNDLLRTQNANVRTTSAPAGIEIQDLGHTYYTGKGGKKHSLLKFWLILIVLTLLTPNMTTKLPYHPPMFREEVKLKKLHL